MMKPGVGTYDRFKELFDKYSKQAGKEQYLIPYFIAAHPGTTDEDMLELALWLKRNGFRADQVQAFLPSPMATATAMYHSGKNPLHKVTHSSEDVVIPKGTRQRRLHKAFLRYHDPNNWPLLREALRAMGRSDLIGNGRQHLVPTYQPVGTGRAHEGRRSAGGGASHRGSRPASDGALHRGSRVGDDGASHRGPRSSRSSGIALSTEDPGAKRAAAATRERAGMEEARSTSGRTMGAATSPGVPGARSTKRFPRSDSTGHPERQAAKHHPFKTQHTGLPTTPRPPGAGKRRTKR